MIADLMRTRKFWALLPFLALAAVMVAVTLFSLGAATSRPSPPLVYTKDTYDAERLVYVPGETLVYTASLTIAESGDVDVERGWRTRPGEARSLLCDGTPAPVLEDDPPPFSPGAVDNEVEGRITVRVPDLQPGDHWLISSVKGLGEAVTRVPVRIERPCPGG
jgi:hypothetical protein